MARRLVVALALVVAGLSGCLVDEPADHVLDAFGLDQVAFEDGDLYVVAPVLEGRVDPPGAGGAWFDQDVVRLEPPTVHVEKDPPGPQGGGGVRVDLALAPFPVEVRFRDAHRLAGLTVQWGVQHGAGDVSWTGPEAADEAYAFMLDAPGVYGFVARFVDGDRVVALTAVPFVAYVSVTWSVESHVFPLKAAGPFPPNYDDMADAYRLPLTAPLPAATLQTRYRGEWTPASGADVDLELVDPEGRTSHCSMNAFADGPAGPETAREEILAVGLDPGTWTARVGAVSAACASVPELLQYWNAATVPYTLTVRLDYA